MVQGLGFRIQDSGSMVHGSGFRVEGLRVSEFRDQASGLRV